MAEHDITFTSDLGRVFSVVVTSTPEQREAWLAEVRDLVRASFPIGV